eukprot:11540239-Ditylum_brightwellii.AAC.1
MSLFTEPTNGLDSRSAKVLLEILKDLAKNRNKTVITSIHQPSSAVFRSFDTILMLVDGSVVYHGTPLDSLQYLKAHGHECPDGYNAADHWIELLTPASAVRSRYCSRRQGGMGDKMSLISAWDNESFGKYINGKGNGTEMILNSEEKVESNKKRFDAGWFAQFYVLSNRCFKNTRSSLLSPMRAFKAIVLAYHSQEAAFFAVDDFLVDRKIIMKERESGSYALSAYFMAKTFSSLPLRLCQSFIEMSISYWLSMINIGFDAFLGYTLCNLLVAVASESLGIICVTSLVRRDSIYAVLYTVQSIMLFMA